MADYTRYGAKVLNRVWLVRFVRDLPLPLRVISLFALITKNKKSYYLISYLEWFFFWTNYLWRWLEAFTRWSTLLCSARQHPSGWCAQGYQEGYERWNGTGSGMRPDRDKEKLRSWAGAGLTGMLRAEKDLKHDSFLWRYEIRRQLELSPFFFVWFLLDFAAILYWIKKAGTEYYEATCTSC